ncbi:MAG: Glycerol-3-phosphate cytidyltransferase TagD [Candidatus Levybacteria bacterium GW2011_GWA2_40_16]|nr:MAG: Glycerol-3-phosphate cytidyltransferase TagD [Candidatus Levybacteria bacterium GW2011_GWA1_39_11]KKR25668.1 MAG: Glycerol-3-phosphate cytidyltransferase TagD [Microgenomates group bacterium GW2011_GWC1_39_7]KKR49402.1 MAG: Glycerol-3-phosphate cytidyltransferase TagD [Candidatus Levybacteria bacterium GW2011_GWA2_40_16]OGH45593.1 MAG: hypothetical protein A3H82_02285 [Candidatus Levybacteria bacterium RIFCSPLOWO2_02_FULL_39_26]
MGRIINYEQTPALTKQLKTMGKRIVLVGGCFDILHKGHIEFLKRSKSQGGILVVALENDQKVRELKGKGKPINLEKDRAVILSNLSSVDYVICLPYLKKDIDYETLVKQIEPDIIAVTENDPIFEVKKGYAESVGGKIVTVVARLKGLASSKLAQGINKL